MTLMEWAETPKLGRQNACVYMLMRNGAWWTFSQLREAMRNDLGVWVSEAGVSARIRDLRKPPLKLTVERTKTECAGIFAYRIVS